MSTESDPKVFIRHYRINTEKIVHEMMKATLAGNAKSLRDLSKEVSSGPSPELYLEPYSKKEKGLKKFEPLQQGGKTEVTIRFADGKEVTGVANCSMQDQFCYATGRELARKRAWEQVLAED